MSIWTREELNELIKAWKAAWLAASTGKSYTIGSRTLTRYDLKEIEATLDKLAAKLAELDGRGGIKRVTMRVRRP